MDAVEAVAKDVGRPMAHVALACVRQKRGVTAPIIGFTKAAQLTDALDGLDFVLTPGQIQRLEAPYAPHDIAGF